MKRRKFFSGFAAAALLLGSGAGLSARTPVPINRLRLQMEACRARLGESFALHSVSGQRRYGAKLEAVNSAGRGEQFYLRFAVYQPGQFSEDLYKVIARDGQEMLLHMVPSVSEPNTLEAVVNLQTV